MKTNSEIIDSIWYKYNTKQYLNDSFFKCDIVLKEKIDSIRRIIYNFLASAIFSIGIVYAGYSIVNLNSSEILQYKSENTSMQIQDNIVGTTTNYLYQLPINYSNEKDVIYLMIKDKEEYNQIKRAFIDLPEMSNGDFEKEFIIILISRLEKNNGLEVESYSFINDELLINASVRNDNNEISYMKVSKDYYSKNVEINIKHYEPKHKNGKDITEIKEYNDINEEYNVVIDRRNINNVNILDDFLNNIEENNNSSIRIIVKENNVYFKVYDIEYLNGVYYFASYNSISGGLDYGKYNKLNIVENKNSSKVYALENNDEIKYLFELKGENYE